MNRDRETIAQKVDELKKTLSEQGIKVIYLECDYPIYEPGIVYLSQYINADQIALIVDFLGL